MNKLILILLAGISAVGCQKNPKTEVVEEIKEEPKEVIAEVPQQSFSNKYEFNTIQFDVNLTGSTLTVTPSGYENDNAPVVKTIDGKIVNAEVGDINGDNSPELFIYTVATDGSERGSVIGFSSNKNKSMSEITIPSWADNPELNKGYNGKDQFGIVENRLGHRFPIESENAASKTRQVQYKLVDGEASRKLVVDKVIEF